MTVIESQFKKLNVKYKKPRLIEFYYPKLIIFEDSNTYQIIDLEIKKTENEENKYSLDGDVTDIALQGKYLWIILSTGAIKVTDVISGSQRNIVVNNYSKLCFVAKKITTNTMFFKSGCGENLLAPYSTEEIFETNENETESFCMTLKKTNHTKCIVHEGVHVNGLNLNIKEGNLISLCPITGQSERIISSSFLEYVLLWNEMIILGDSMKMWLINLESSNILYEFENSKASYIPIAVHKNVLYYLTSDNNGVYLCHGRISSAENNSSYDTTMNSSQKVYSQESLISDLEMLIESIFTSGKTAQTASQLQPLFENIEDIDYLINVAIKLYRNNVTFKSYFYLLQKRLFNKGDDKLVYKIGDTIIKMDLLEYINFRCNTSYNDINIFEKNYKDLCILFLSKSDFDIASICWLKYSVLKIHIISNDIIEIINSIPNNTKIGAMVVWLRNFTPYILEQNPFYIDVFVRWAMERIFILEQSTYWPKIGSKFIDEIIAVLETSLKTISLRPISMDDLDILKDRINYISELKDKYKINILLSELSSQSPSEVALIMLRRCYTEDLEGLLQDYLPTYATRHLFDVDDILRTFIESESASSGGTIDGSRLEIILNNFRNPVNKLECLLLVLKALDVPWNPAVIKVAVDAAAAANKDFTASDPDRVLAQEIQKEINYANVKVVLKKYNFPLTCTNYQLVLQNVVSCPVVDLDDLKSIITVMSSYANYGNSLYINKCLENCDCKAALEYFQNMSQKERVLLLKTIIVKYEQILNGKYHTKVIERNYIDFMKGTNMLNEIQLKNIDNLYHLKHSYQIELNMNDIYVEEIISSKVDTWLHENKDKKSDTGNADGLYRLIPAGRATSSSLFTLLQGTSATHKVRNFIQNLIRLSEFQSTSSEWLKQALIQIKDEENTSLLIDSYSLLTEIVKKCNEENLHNLIKDLSILNVLVNNNITVKNLTTAWKFNYIFLSLSSSLVLNDFIDFMVLDKTIENIEKHLLSVQNKCDFTPIRIISNAISSSGCDVNSSDFFVELKSMTCKKLLAKLLVAQEFDEILTTLLLLVEKNSENDFSLLETLKGPDESISPVLMCFMTNPIIRRAFNFENSLGNTVVYPPKYVLKTKFNINLSEISLPENTEETWDVKVILFYILKQYPNTTCERLIDLCRALNVSTNDGLSLQLISILTTWDLQYKINCDKLGWRQIVTENNPDLYKKCSIIWDNIISKDFLKDILKDFWRNGEVVLHGRTVSVNPYYYEVFLCIHSLLFGMIPDTNTVKEYFLLNFLKEYKRISAPKQYEFEMFSVKGIFPEIGYYRLPFHLFMRDDMWSNLKSEITLETYERWLPIVSLLSLDSDSQIAKDMVCSNALKQTMTSRQRSSVNDVDPKDSEPWRLICREESLLRAAHRCVKHIANMEWAGACLFYVLQGCTRGADQVAAAQLCYQFAQRWAALQPGNRAVKQMERLHATLSTRHVLYKINWACEEFVRLSTEPAQLIRALYLHPDFFNKLARHDINRAANEIADKNNINISSIRIQILENLLDKSKDQNSILNTKELIIAKYILRATCPKMGAIYLSRIVFDEDSDFNKCKKMRALQCLMSVVEPDTAIKVTNKERDALWMCLLELLSIVKLEMIDMPWVVITFTQDKRRALEQLIQAVEGNIAALKTTANLAYQFGDTVIIRNLIPFLLRLNLYDELRPLLVKIFTPPDSMIYTAWRAVILSPFQNADYPITERQKRKCLDALNLLPICPVIKDDDLKDIWKNCVRLKSLGLGCLVFPYMSPQGRQSLGELQKIDRRNLIASLKNLHTDTYLVSGAMHVIESMASRTYKH